MKKEQKTAYWRDPCKNGKRKYNTSTKVKELVKTNSFIFLKKIKKKY